MSTLHTKTIDLTCDGVTAKISVQSANVMHGLVRMNKQTESKDETDSLRWFARYWLFSACVACSEGEISAGEEITKVGDLTFDAYYALSDAITVPWLNAILEINPHWLPDSSPTDEEKKKA